MTKPGSSSVQEQTESIMTLITSADATENKTFFIGSLAVIVLSTANLTNETGPDRGELRV